MAAPVWKLLDQPSYIQCNGWNLYDYMLWNDSKEDGNVRSECKDVEGTDSEDGDNDTD